MQKREFLKALGTAAVAAPVAALTAGASGNSETKNTKPTLARVNQSRIIRGGYVQYEPALVQDMKTGQWRGFDYEIINAVADRLELKAELSQPTGWASVMADLNADKIDMLCSGFWVHPNVAKYGLFSRPFFYQPVFIVAREGDARFHAKTNWNDAALTMVALDGDNPVHIAQTDYPKTKILTLPNMTDFSQVLVNVATGKADFTIVDAYTFGAYNENNPGKLRIVNADKPVRIYPVSYLFKAEDNVFRDAVNAALEELILDGTINRILSGYNKYPNAYYMPVIDFAHLQ